MSTQVDEKVFRLDGLKWVVAIAIIGGATYANSYFASEVGLLYRILALVALGIVAAFVLLQTAKGDAFWELCKAAQLEVRKVVWPSRQEVNQTTLIVLGVVVVMALILWLLDSGLGKLASMVIG